MENLVEIKRGQVGRGLLIEHDGYASLSKDKIVKLNEDFDSKEGMYCPDPFIVDAVFQKFGIKNANGRIYPEDVLKRQVAIYSKKIEDKNAIGEENHPPESTIDLSRVAMNIVELHWEENTLVGKFELLVSPGFRKYGIISCCADEVANHLLHGIKIGVSSRGIGTVTQSNGVLIVGDDYEIICWDIVSDPSTPGAWISTTGKDALSQYVESDESNKNKPILSENGNKLDRIELLLADF